MFVAFIPSSDREVLRIAITRTWEPRRMPTPRFIDSWTTVEKEGKDQVPVVLGSNCENVVVMNLSGITDRDRRQLYMEEGELSFCRVFAKSGPGREVMEPVTTNSIDDDVGDYEP